MSKYNYYLLSLLLLFVNEIAGQIPPNHEFWGYDYDFTDDDPAPNIPMSENENGVAHFVSRSYDGLTGSTTIQYFDGLGREKETVLLGASPTTGDIVTLQEYDTYGRKGNTWLPAVLSSQGGLCHQANAVRQSSVSSNGQDASPYSFPVYEQNPLSRIVHQYRPGNDWHSNQKSLKTEYLTNIANDDVLNCLKVELSTTNTLRVLGNHQTGKLKVLKITDEDGDIHLEFYDTVERLILSRTIMSYGDDALDTYYVYDGFSNLYYVFPPNASALLQTGSVSNSIKNKSYRYVYDSRNRLIKKTFPDADAMIFAYDEADRVILTQDGEQRQRAVCTFHVYDAYGRECVMGECSNAIGNGGSATSSYARATYTGTGSYMGYDVTGITLNTPQILSVKYYDSYDFLNNDSLNYVNDTSFGPMHPCPRGLVTGTVSARLADSISYDCASFYYDHHSRLIQQHSTNHLGGYEHEKTGYDFVGNVVRQEKVHTASGKAPVKQLYQRAYDNEGRLLTTTHSLNDAPAVTLIDNEYDDLGRLSADNRNGHASLRTTYAYNVRSWATSIASSLFSQTLHYTSPPSTALPRYCGNISALSESVSRSDSVIANNYAFSYDGAKRLVEANYSGSMGNDWFSTSYQYDNNGNMTGLIRRGPDASGHLSYWDNLTFTYYGNQLRKVSDAAPIINTYNSMQFNDGCDSIAEYSYDKNGNMKKDLNRNISLIQYNFLNLPKKITISNGYEKMIYSINGEKLHLEIKQMTLEPIVPDPFTPIGQRGGAKAGIYPIHTSSDYCRSVIYQNGTLNTVLVDGGYISFIHGTPTYHFYVKDYLGNNRIVASTNGAVEQTTMYYPFGVSRNDSQNTSETQPYKYNGKELDTENTLCWYDYGARWYDPILTRFTTIDPLCEKYYSISPYAYCANNPVNAVDPDGRRIVLSGSWFQKQLMLGWLQSLTNDELIMKNGVVSIASQGTQNTSKSFPVGTKLISELINHDNYLTVDYVTTNKNVYKVHYNKEADASNGKGSNASFRVNNIPVNLLVENKRTGKSIYEVIPKSIALGHELIHAYHGMNGIVKNGEAEYIYKNENDVYMKVLKADPEELETTGLTGDIPFTENKLRKEHEINQRIKY